MAISANDKYLLNNKMGAVAHKVGLGTLIEAAESVAASEIALADGKVLIGNVSGVGAAKSLTGAITIDRDGAATLGADVVTNAKIADTAVSVEHLDSGIAPSHVVKFAGKSTSTANGGGVNAVTVTGVAATDVVIASLEAAAGTPRTLLIAVPTTNTITFTYSGDPSTTHIVSYMVLRAAA